MSMYDVKVSGHVRHNGVRYAPGDVIRRLTEREARGLVKLGVAAEAIPSDAAPDSGPGQAPPDPNTPWGLVSLSAAEAAEHIAKVENVKFLNAVEALEELREKPRATVLRAIEARRQELEPSAALSSDPSVLEPVADPADSIAPADSQEGGGDGGNNE